MFLICKNNIGKTHRLLPREGLKMKRAGNQDFDMQRTVVLLNDSVLFDAKYGLHR